MLIMNTRLLVLALLLLIAVTLHAQAKTDVIVMANSDRLNCEVTGPDTLTTPSDGYREHERTYGQSVFALSVLSSAELSSCC